MVNLQHKLEAQGFLSLNQFCQYLKEFEPTAYVSYPTALKLVNEGKIRAVKIGAHYRINRVEANRWVTEGNWERQLASPYSTTR